MKLATRSNALIKKGLPQKFEDPSSFTILDSIGSFHINQALMDLGTSINLISLAMLRKIGNLEVMPLK